jgi:protein-L-isoaspartate(D-aspartate) O-methyltransferase
MTDSRADERDALVDRLRKRGHVEHDHVADALRAVPRHEFLPEGVRSRAYDDRPLSIGNEQTVSAPHMVGLMCELLPADAVDVLEVGTGCGYHAAVTAACLPEGHVYSVEYDADLAAAARETLSELGYGGRVSVRVGDGRDGWPERAPFDCAYLTCAVTEVPDAIRQQVRPGGRIVAPVGTASQTLVTLDRHEDGSVERTDHGGVRFVRVRGGEHEPPS